VGDPQIERQGIGTCRLAKGFAARDEAEAQSAKADFVLFQRRVSNPS
jgi:hypothetical protein